MSHATATKTAAKKPAKKKVSAFSTRKVDPAYYWMVVPAAIIFAFFLYLPFLDGVKYSFTNSQGYGDYKFIEELHRPLPGQPSGPCLPVHVPHRHSHHGAD